jgi:hypothetical protein
MGKKSRFGSRMNIPDHISESLETTLTLDPGSGMRKFGFGIRDKHPGFATLVQAIFF